MEINKQDWRNKHAIIRSKLNWTDVPAQIATMYLEREMSGPEISEYIFDRTGVSITPRSIQRQVKRYKQTRTKKDAMRLASVRTRATWHNIPNELRFKILDRDGKSCQLCGSKVFKDKLDIRHIISKDDGGTDNEFNLRVECEACFKNRDK